MNLKAEIEALRKAIKPPATIRFTMDRNDIDESIPGVIWVFFAIETQAQSIVDFHANKQLAS